MLDGKVAVVTGGTRGIGFATVKRFLENGASVFLLGSGEESVGVAVAKLRAEDPGYQVDGLWPNLSDAAEVARAFGTVRGRYGRLDVLVNNAGIAAMDSIYSYRPEDFARIMDLNVTSVFTCSQAAARLMKEQGGGVILNTSSMAGLYGQSTGCGYPASKFAVNGLTKSLARELGRDGIRVNAVAPGVIDTEMMAGVPETLLAPVVARIPLGRVGRPEEVANAFLFLASGMASYITGAVLSVDGATIG
ncbi:MAG: 3-oxoacyl-ACP reductase FabG [Methanospirillum sp.]|nr:3-oxoacyl-ACP reductase FabG [Methanospirillum sp.]